jgi:dienelactone hydrolase
MTSSSSCCPPGSVEVPCLGPDDAQPKGELMLMIKGSLPTYYAAPPTKSKCGIIVYTDVWGLQSRIQLICDWLASQGNYHVIIADCFRGKTKDDHREDMIKWFQSTPYDTLVAKDTKVCFDFMKSKRVTAVGSMGFCWGAWAIGKSSEAGIPWKVAVTPHPSFGVEKMAFGGDDVALMQNIKCPLLLLPAGNDVAYVMPESEQVQQLAKNGTKSIVFQEMKHGWMTLGDVSDPKIRRDVDAVLKETLQFFQKHLK